MFSHVSIRTTCPVSEIQDRPSFCQVGIKKIKNFLYSSGICFPVELLKKQPVTPVKGFLYSRINNNNNNNNNLSEGGIGFKI